MATSTLTVPNDFSMAKNVNSLRFRIQSDEYITTAGVEYQLSLQLNSLPLNNEVLQIDSVVTGPLTFTFKDIATDCEHVQIGATTAETLTNLNATLQKNYQLFQNYYFNLAAQLNLTARQPGTDYNFTILGGDVFPRFSTISINGVNQVVRDDLRIVVSVYVLVNTLKELAAELEFVPDENGIAEFDIYEIILAYLSHHLPTLNSSAVQIATGPLVTYEIKHTDYYNAEYHCYESTGNIIACLAGYPERIFSNSNYANSYFLDTAARKFLTRIPSGLFKIPADAPFYLYWYVRTTGTYKLGAHVYYTDDSNDTFLDLKNITTQNNLVCWPCGFEQLGLDSLVDTDKEVDFYEVFIINSDDILTATVKSESFFIYLDHTYYENNIYFLFGNSLGGTDIAWFNGNITKKSITSGDDYTIYPPVHNEEVVYGEFKSGIKTFRNEFTYFSGFKTKNYTDYLQEILKSEIIHKLSAKYIEMQMISDDLELYTQLDEQFGVSLQMMPAQIERGYAHD